jgi:hypothetical protein
MEEMVLISLRLPRRVLLAVDRRAGELGIKRVHLIRVLLSEHVEDWEAEDGCKDE